MITWYYFPFNFSSKFSFRCAFNKNCIVWAQKSKFQNRLVSCFHSTVRTIITWKWYKNTWQADLHVPQMQNHVEILPKIVSSDHTFRNERKHVIQDVLWYLVIFRFLEKKKFNFYTKFVVILEVHLLNDK